MNGITQPSTNWPDEYKDFVIDWINKGAAVVGDVAEQLLIILKKLKKL